MPTTLKGIAIIFLTCYTVIFVIVFEYQSTHLLEDTLPFILSSGGSSKTQQVGKQYSQLELKLTAHLYRNNSHIPIVFDVDQNEGATSRSVKSFPIIDNYPEGDPYLPWIHDVFPSKDNSKVIILAQNRRRCHTGKHKKHVMEALEPQIALFQPISLKICGLNGDQQGQPEVLDQKQLKQKQHKYMLWNHENATIKETRFQCRFKLYQNSKFLKEEVTFSKYPFNYEYITWRKKMDTMFESEGKGMAQFWLSSLEFHCPVPSSIQIEGMRNNGNREIFLDIATIKTPVRRKGEWFLEELEDRIWDVKNWGTERILPKLEESTRWENILIPLKHSIPTQRPKKAYELVACTWSSAAHNRRGDAVTLNDGKDRLREWIAFNLLVGFDHVVVYDNSAANTNTTSLKEVTNLFDSKKVTHINWPCKVCNNNRPAHDDPGERSSQYAAEASCRARFGPETDWMTFLDPDEYLIPMGKFKNWKDILKKVDETEGRKILKFRSTRARPRVNLLEPTFDASFANCPSKEEVADQSKPVASCLVAKRNETFLRTYNCEYIKSPKPDRFQRAMKQLYRPDFVLSHFVHYSTVTTDLARRKADTSGEYVKAATNNPKAERFMDELNEGVMIHAKSIVPTEAVSRNTRCVYKKTMCGVGIECPSDLPFSDATHKDGFLHGKNEYCNCWINTKVENFWIPRLEKTLENIG